MIIISKYCVYIDDNLESKLDLYVKNNNFKTKSSAIRDCLNKVLVTNDYQNSIYDINQKLSRILYRQNINRKILEQLFVNFGFPTNYDIDNDKMLKEIMDKNNKYVGKFD